MSVSAGATVDDRAIVSHIDTILKNADLKRTTYKDIQRQLEAELGVSFSHRKQFIRDEVKNFFCIRNRARGGSGGKTGNVNVTGVKRERHEGNEPNPPPDSRRRRVEEISSQRSPGVQKRSPGIQQTPRARARTSSGAGYAGSARSPVPNTASGETCPAHNVPLVTRTCGANAMPHNHGRQFVCCPRPGCAEVWRWADGTAPGGAEAQARFRTHTGRYGLGGYDPDRITFF